jgi:hypothetical protein
MISAAMSYAYGVLFLVKEELVRRTHLLNVLVAILLVAGLLAPSTVIASSPTAVTTLIPYRKGNVWGFCDQNKKMVIPAVYEDASCFSDGLAYVEPKKKWGLWSFIDTKGNMAIDYIYEAAESFSDGLALVKLNGKYGFIDTKGNMVIDAICDFATGFIDGRALIEAFGDAGYIDTKGNVTWL